MTVTTSRKKNDAPAAPIGPISFDEIAAKRMRERIEAYRALVKRQAAGESLSESDAETGMLLMEQLGLPQYAFNRDVEAVQRHAVVRAKWDAAVANEPANRERAKQLAGEINEAEKKLRMLREEFQRANAATGKPGTYSNTLLSLASDHPHVLADLETAVRLRLDDINRRRQIVGGGAA